MRPIRTSIGRFQQGDVPLFPVSLNARGVGLNPAAADAVIHYDPRWNPVVENRGIDRSRRLGQNKPVSVYKLIPAGSIEEKVVAIRKQKVALVDTTDTILCKDAADPVRFSAEMSRPCSKPIWGQAKISVNSYHKTCSYENSLPYANMRQWQRGFLALI